MSPKTRRRCVLIVRIVLTLLAFALAVIAAAVQAKKLHVSPVAQMKLAMLIAAMAGLDSARTAVRTYLTPGKDRARSRAQKTVISALVNIARDHGGVDLQHLGASVFCIRRRGWPRQLQLVRVLRFRLDDHPPPSPVAWTKGKGLIGYVWETNTPQHKSRAECKRQQRHANVTEPNFRTLSNQLRSCFTHKDWLNIVDKYGEIFGVPIPDHEGNLIGVLSIDVAKKAPLTKDILKSQEVTEYATTAAELLRDDLRSLYDEA